MRSANTYTFGVHRDLTPSALFFLIFLDEAQRQLGVEDIVALGGAIIGYPFLSTRGKFAGATKGTSVASIVSRKMLPYDIKYRMLPTLTLKSAAQLKVVFTRNLGVFVGRAIPVVGEVILVIDIFFITSSSVRNYNRIVKREDKIF